MGGYDKKADFAPLFKAFDHKIKRVIALTEFGGYSLPVSGHTFSNKRFGYKVFDSADELEAAVLKLYEKDVFPAVGNMRRQKLYAA